jgi:hypothetical protein
MHDEQPLPIEIDPMSGWLDGQHDINCFNDKISTFKSFVLQRGEPISASNVVKRMENCKG